MAQAEQKGERSAGPTQSWPARPQLFHQLLAGCCHAPQVGSSEPLHNSSFRHQQGEPQTQAATALRLPACFTPSQKHGRASLLQVHPRPPGTASGRRRRESVGVDSVHAKRVVSTATQVAQGGNHILWRHRRTALSGYSGRLAPPPRSSFNASYVSDLHEALRHRVLQEGSSRHGTHCGDDPCPEHLQQPDRKLPTEPSPRLKTMERSPPTSSKRKML